MKSVKVTYANGDEISTGINGTDKEIEKYFAIGREFNLGTGEEGKPEDNMQAITALEFLPLKTQGQMNIYKDQCGDCSNGGLSSDYEKVEIWPDYDRHAPRYAVVIVEDICCGEPRKRAIPANSEGKWSMFGGCFVFTCNGIVPHSGDAIKLHDRFEHNTTGRE